MTELYILRNQDGYFWGKQKEWLDGRDRGALFKTPHKDEAVNQMVEISAKDYEQRVKVLPCRADERGLPLLAEDDLPPARSREEAAETDPAREPDTSELND